MQNEIVKYELCSLFYDEIVREVTFEQFENFEHQRKMLVFFVHFEELYEIVKENFRDFWRTLFEISEDYRLHIFRDRSKINKEISNLNLRIINILNSVRAYQDHLEHQLTNDFDKNSKYIIFLRKTIKDIYDNLFEYRFLIRLRNYTQHFRNPVDKVSYHCFDLGTKSAEIAFTISPIIYKKNLLEYDGWSNVKSDIEKQNDDINLVPILDAFFRALGQIHSIMRKELESIYDESNSLIKRLYCECEEYLKSKNIPQTPSANIVCSFKDGNATSVWIPYDLIATIEKYRTMNANFSPKGFSFTTLQPNNSIKSIQEYIQKTNFE